jgi:methyl coenzyme M reductase beta subunit
MLKLFLTIMPQFTVKFLIRGGKEVLVQVGSARLYVNAHQKKRFLIALKYIGPSEYR